MESVASVQHSPEIVEQALGKAQKLADQLRASEARIKELEAQVRVNEHRAESAEKWLAHVRDEIEERFFGGDTAPSANGRSSRGRF